MRQLHGFSWLAGGLLCGCFAANPLAEDTDDDGAGTQEPTASTGGSMTAGGSEGDATEADESASTGGTGDSESNGGTTQGTESTTTGGVDGESGDTGPVAAPQVRVLHVSPRTEPVDVYIEGVSDPIATDLAYGTASGFVDLEPGAHVFEFRQAGEDPARVEPFHRSEPIVVGAGERVTAMAGGLAAEGEGTTNFFRVTAFREEFEEPGENEAVVRFAHLGLNSAPTVGVDLGADGSVEFNAVAEFDASGEQGAVVPAHQDLRVRLTDAGGSELAPGATLTEFTIPSIEEGRELWLTTTGVVGSANASQEPGFSLVSLADDGTSVRILQDPIVYVVHGVPDADEMNVCLEGEVIADGLAFGEAASLRVSPGDYDELVFSSSGQYEGCALGRIIEADVGDLEPGAERMYVAYGELSGEDDDALSGGSSNHQTDVSREAEGDTRLRLYEAVTMLPWDHARGRPVHTAS